MRRSETSGTERAYVKARGLLLTILVAGVIALIVRAFLAQVFVIPSLSMSPTLQPSDRVVVEKFSRLFSDIDRGDVVVFDRPASLDGSGAEDYLIKRTIGLPGETINGEDGAVYVNGRPLEEPWLDGVETSPFSPVTLDDDEYFFMGDNRPSSEDGRFFGPVQSDQVVGVAVSTIWPLSRVGLL